MCRFASPQLLELFLIRLWANFFKIHGPQKGVNVTCRLLAAVVTSGERLNVNVQGRKCRARSDARLNL
jgi:hypothetical protein